MIVINENDFGLNDLAGLAVTYLEDHNLPNNLYVYGLSDNWPAATYVDPEIHNANRIAAFLASICNEEVVVGLPTRPRERPAIGLARRLRTPHNIGLSTRMAVFTLFAINNRINFTIPAYRFQVNDMVRYPRAGEISAGTITRVDNNEIVVVRNMYTNRNHITSAALLEPLRPDARNQRVRPLQDRPSYADGEEELDQIRTTHVGNVLDIRNNTVYWNPDNNPYRNHYGEAITPLSIDINQLIRIA